jgi:hypothetical protein
VDFPVNIYNVVASTVSSWFQNVWSWLVKLSTAIRIAEFTVQALNVQLDIVIFVPFHFGSNPRPSLFVKKSDIYNLILNFPGINQNNTGHILVHWLMSAVQFSIATIGK